MQKIKNKRIFLLATIVILFFALFNFSKIDASECTDSCETNYPNDADAQKDCENKCDDLEDKAKAYEKIINLKEKQSKALAGQIENINQQQVVTQMSLSETKKKVKDLAQKIDEISRDIAEKEKSMEYKKKLLKSLMQSHYESDQEGVLSLILINENFSEVFGQIDRIGQSGAKINELLAEIEKTKAELSNNKSEMESKKGEYEEAKSDLEQKNLNLQYTENQKQTLLGQTEEEKKKYQDLLNSIESEIEDIESGLASSADYSNIPPAKGDYFDYPVAPPIRITQGYGKTSFSKNYSSGKHNGIDFGVNNKNVFAAKESKVIGVGNNGKYAYGKWIAIDHGDGLVTLYGHFSKQSVPKVLR